MNVSGYLENILSPVLADGFMPTLIGDAADANVLIKRVLNILLVIVVIAAVVFIMVAGIQYVSSQGDANKAKQAMSSITNAIIGMIVAFAAYALVTIVMKNIIGQEVTEIPDTPIE